MSEPLKRLGLILVLAGLGGLLRHGLVSLLGDTGLLLCNYGAVYGLVYLSGHLFRTWAMKPTWQDGLTIGFFGGLSTIAPIFLELTLAIEAGNWWRVIMLFGSHILGGYFVALLANSRANKDSQEANLC